VLVQSTSLLAASIDIPSGTTASGQESVGGTDQLTIEQGGVLSVDDTAIKWNSAATDLRITNEGLIESTAVEGRAVNAGGSATAPRNLTLSNNAGGIIRAQNDAIRINVDITGGNVKLTNAGTILSSVDGQAIDFDAISSTSSGAVEINNLVGGMIQSTDADAIRPGEGAVVNNAGTIYAGKVSNDSSDGIDFQSHSGTVHNYAGGLISGARHGITTDADVTVINDAGATIIGRNGSGVGSDGSATVINYGTITGTYDGSGNGDGDGVDIDNGGTIENYGVIQALGSAGVHSSDGHPNGSDGATIGGVGGTVINHAGALIYSVGGAVPITTGTVINDGTITSGSIGVLFATGAGLLVNTGTITGQAIGALGSAAADNFTNSGTISSPTTAIDMGGGDDQLTLLPGSVLEGTVDGGDGYDQVTLGGTGDGSFAGAVNFERLEVALGNWTLTGASAFSDGTLIDGAATLNGSASVLTGAITDNGTLVVDQPTNGTFTAALSGGGLLRKAGAGTLVVGTQAFTGRTDVAAGTLQLAGTLPSAVTVERGARLAGTGQIASATIASGGTVAPAAGTLTVTGNFVQQANSAYAATILPGAASSRIAVGGTATIGSGATLDLTRGAGTYAIGTRYTLLTAAGGITGSYAINQTPLNGTELRVTASGTALFADLVRTGASLAGLAANPDQAAVASAFSTLGVGNAAYAALTLNPDDAAVRTALTRLDGEVHASARTAMVHDALLVEKTVAARFDTPVSEAKGLWGQLLVNAGQDEGASGGSNTHRNTLGGIGGFDTQVGEGLRIGVAGGYTRTRDHIDDTSDRARIGTWHLVGYAGGRIGGIDARAGIGYAWGRVNTRRSISFTGFSDADRARYDTNTLHGFGEIGVPVPVGGGSVEPFAGGAVIRIHNDAFAETGGAAALQGRARNETVEFSDVGLRARTPVTGNLSVVAGVAWQHAFDTVRPDATLAFAGSGTPFSVIGARLSRDAATPTATLAWQPQAGLRMTLTYAGEIGDAGTDSAARIGLTLGF
jgi:outer membrane autotransporter protein